MAKFSLIGAALIAITVLIHALGTTLILRNLSRYVGVLDELHPLRTLRLLIVSVLAVFVLHVVEIMVWAWTYLAVLPDGQLGSFEEAVYFSFVTFTTLGYGEITLSEGYRLLSGIEALNGILLVGWSTAMLFAAVQRLWQVKRTNRTKHERTHHEQR